jgi:hypothetical protein
MKEEFTKETEILKKLNWKFENEKLYKSNKKQLKSSQIYWTENMIKYQGLKSEKDRWKNIQTTINKF